MAVIHKTTLSPGKLELLTAWLPAQPWYRQTGQEAELARAGGFRLDDPQGEVGIEFMVVTDESGNRATTYQIPLTYRASVLAGGGLIGTAEHGVLGHAGYMTAFTTRSFSLSWSRSSREMPSRKHRALATRPTPRRPADRLQIVP
jgi:hypothetical protein